MSSPFDRGRRRSIRLKGYDYTQAGAYFVTICAQGRVCLFGDIVDGEMRLNDAGAMVLSTWEAIPRHYAGVEIDEVVVMPNDVHGIVVLSGVGAAPRGRPASGDRTLPYPGHAEDGDGDDVGQARGPAPTGLSLGEVVVMPNDVHGIVVLSGVGAAPRGRPASGDRTLPYPGHAEDGDGDDVGQARGPAPTGLSLGEVVQRYKTLAAPRGRPASGDRTLPYPGHAEDGDGDDVGQARGPAPTGLSLGELVQRFKTLTTRRYIEGVRVDGWPKFRSRLWQRNYYEHVIRNDDALERVRQYIVDNPAQWATDRENPANEHPQGAA